MLFFTTPPYLHEIIVQQLTANPPNQNASRARADTGEDLHTCFTVSVTLKVNARTQPIGHTRADYSQAHLILLISFHSRGHSLHTDLESQNDTGWRSLLRSLVYASVSNSSPRPHSVKLNELQNISRTEESTTPQSLCSNV